MVAGTLERPPRFAKEGHNRLRSLQKQPRRTLGFRSVLRFVSPRRSSPPPLRFVSPKRSSPPSLGFVSPTRPSPPSLRFVSPKRLPTRWASKAGTRNGRTVRRRRGVAFQGPSRNLVCSHPILFWFVQKSTACSEDCGGKRKIAERPPIPGLPEIGMSCGGESGPRSKSYRPGGAQAARGFSFKRLRTQNPNTPTSVSARPNQVMAYCR